MVMRRGEIWWADLDDPDGSELGFRRPVLIVQSDIINTTAFRTVIIVALTSNLERRQTRHNIFISARVSGLPKDSVVLPTSIEAINKDRLRDKVCALPRSLMIAIDHALSDVLGLND